MADITYSGTGRTHAEREDAFREFHADHLRRQTKHLQVIRAILSTWFVLTILGVVVLIASTGN